MFIKTEDPEELARAHRRLGYRAAYCPRVDLTDTPRMNAIAKALPPMTWSSPRSAGGATSSTRSGQAGRESENRHPGARSGRGYRRPLLRGHRRSYNKESWFGPHPDNLGPRFFDETVENARAIIDAVKPKRARFCFEMMGWSPARLARLLLAADQGDRPAGVRRPCRRRQHDQFAHPLLSKR